MYIPINPYNEKNKIYKNLELFFNENEHVNIKIETYIKDIIYYFFQNIFISIDSNDLKLYIIENFQIYLLNKLFINYKNYENISWNNSTILLYNEDLTNNFIDINYDIKLKINNAIYENFIIYSTSNLELDENNKSLIQFYHTYSIYMLKKNNNFLNQSLTYIKNELSDSINNLNNELKIYNQSLNNILICFSLLIIYIYFNIFNFIIIYSY